MPFQWMIVGNMQKMAHGKHETGWITISMDEYESMKATLEILSDPEAMEAIRRGEKDIAEGRAKTLEQVKMELKL